MVGREVGRQIGREREREGDDKGIGKHKKAFHRQVHYQEKKRKDCVVFVVVVPCTRCTGPILQIPFIPKSML